MPSCPAVSRQRRADRTVCRLSTASAASSHHGSAAARRRVAFGAVGGVPEPDEEAKGDGDLGRSDQRRGDGAGGRSAWLSFPPLAARPW